MINILKHIFSFILPFTVLVIVPLWIDDLSQINFGINLIGLALMITGLSIMFVTIFSFITIGKGTLAPWSPTRKLVIVGLYRYVRNPMILGVFTVLLGETVTFESVPILIWTALFFVINTVYFILSEEPGLQKRFGNEYIHYKRNVNRWLPKLTPYNPEQAS